MKIQIDQLAVGYGEAGSPLLFRLPQVQIADKEKLLVIGPSGRGKTTLLHILGGLFRPRAGKVLIGEHDLTRMSDRELAGFRRRQVGFVFQKLNLLPHLTALENIELARADFSESLPAWRERAARNLALLGIEDKQHRLCSRLSLGEQQRVAVARVLTQRPPLILADELTSSLDDKNADEVMKALIKAAENSTLIVVSHDQRIREGFDRILDCEKVFES